MSESRIGATSLMSDEPSRRIVVSDVIFDVSVSMFCGVMVMLVCGLLFCVSSFESSSRNWLPLLVQFGNCAKMYCRLRCANVLISTVLNSESCCGLNCMSFGW